ncbi:MAG: DUF5688 family protein [Clostridium sp.]
MNINEFNQEFCDALQEAIAPEGGRLQAISVPKNNELLQTTTIRYGDDPVGIVVYPDQYYEDYKEGAPMTDIISNIKNNVLTADKPNFALESINREAAPDHLRSAIVGYDKNREWLQDIPHEKISDDMAVFAKWHIGDFASIKVNNQMLSLMQMTKEELLQMAKTNTAANMDYKSMDEVMKDIMMSNGMGEELANAMMMESGGVPMHVLSTKDGIDGAALIADSKVLKQIHEQVGEDFYILPSSIHEVIILLKSDTSGDVQALKDMVTMINGTEVPLHDQLTDNLYEFDGHELTLAGITENLKVEVPGISKGITHRR